MKVLRRDSKSKTFFSCFRAFFWIDLILLFLVLSLQITARCSGSFAEWYAVSVYPFFVNTLGRLWALFPFSVFEFFVAALIIYPIAGIFWLFYRLRHTCEYALRQRIRARALGRFLTIVLSVLLLYTMTCGINYSRKPFSVSSGLTVEPTALSSLVTLCEQLTDSLCASDEYIAKNEAGCSVLPTDYLQTAVEAMQSLGKTYPLLDGYYPPAKPLLSSVWFSYQHISGIYSPFTVEANFNRDMINYNIPFTVCHELSHLRGFMREDEANFIAYLGCLSAKDPYFHYSGKLLAFIYATNALYQAGETESYRAFFARLPEVVQKDLSANNAYWKRFETGLSTVSDKLNDIYLKANSQHEGTQSYGRFVDLLIAYHLPKE